MTEEVWRWSASQTASAVRAGEISCTEAVAAAVERLQTVNAGVNAVTLDLSEQAIESARRADDALRGGDDLGPLHGVPITIKENVDQKGLPTPNGVSALADVIAPDDSPVVANLERAGAIVVGRTNTPEFSLRFFTDNVLRGPTNNPWKTGLTPGGSSGGAAAAVVLGIGDIAHGNDLGGSLRYPAYACGVTTIRPTLGRVPAFNPSSLDERPPAIQLMSVQGPIAREVKDVELALTAMSSGDHRDPWWVPAPLSAPPPASPTRVALIKSPAGFTPHPAVTESLEAAAAHLSDAGYAVEESEPPNLAAIADCWRTLLVSELRMLMEPAIREHGSEQINEVYDSYCACMGEPSLEHYMRALTARLGFLRAWSMFLEDCPLVLMPVSLAPPLPQGEDLKGPERMRLLMDEQATLYSINLLGLPAMTIPTGLHDQAPIGVQLIAGRFREGLCLAAAETIEQRVGVLSHSLWARDAEPA